MSERQEPQLNNQEIVKANDNKLAEVLAVNKKRWIERLQTEEYEEAKEALVEINKFKKWRETSRQSSFSDFYQLFEDSSVLNSAVLDVNEKKKLTGDLADSLTFKAQKMSPRTADLYLGLLSEISGKKYEPQFEQTAKKIDSLKKEGHFDVLTDSSTSFEYKADRMDKMMKNYLQWTKWADKKDREITEEEKEERAKELENQPVKPPEQRNESKPGMDEMSRLKEGERVEAMWTISPAYGGYFKEQSLSSWDNSQNKWTEKYEYSDVEMSPLLESETEEKFNIEMKSKVDAGKWISIAVPYTHALHSVNADRKECHLKQDQNGEVVILADGSGEVELNVKLAYVGKKKLQSEKPTEIPNFQSQLSKETKEELEKIRTEKKNNFAKAQALKSFIARTIKYSNDSSFNDIYDNHSRGYIGAIDEHKQADCDVANTYFAALCVELGIPVCHCVGHSVQGKDEEGNSQIHSGTGHAWSEIWNEVKNEWVRIDATPPGDRQLEDEEDNKSENAPGDYGEAESRAMTDEEIEELQKKLESHTEKLSYTPEERELSEKTRIELKEARQIVKEIQIAENTRLPNGERITDVMAKLFNLIIESRKITSSNYTGPLRKKEGGEEIDDIVGHYIGIKAGDTDPASRQKPHQEIKKEDTFGGFDVYIAGDKTASTENIANSETGETINELQRQAEYLIFSSLHRFNENLKRAKMKMQSELSIRTQGISYRGNKEIDEDKKLSGKFDAEDKVKMWKSLADTEMGWGADSAMAYIYQEIREELENKGVNVEKGETDNRLRFVVVMSDGEFGNEETIKTHQYAEALGKMGVVMLGIGLTKTANNIPTVFNTEWSRGDFTNNMNDLPIIVAKHLIQEAIKLFPEKSKKQSQKIIDGILNKFKKI
ncbi:MAG TPA: hypothetical protein ENJ27_02115 [Candidatus Moranbacteria bacterium]|nr:hypothetical protein [Candidatus Moranbacteria bacterium]